MINARAPWSMIGNTFFYGKRKVDVMSVAGNLAHVVFLDNPKEHAAVDVYYLKPDPYDMSQMQATASSQ